MKRWSDRLAVVTGATSGIGRATALALAQAGMRVLATGRRQHRLAELASDRITTHPADLRSQADILLRPTQQVT